MLPYYGGERTPDRPDAVGVWHGLTPATTRADLARAAFEALLCALADAVDQLVEASGVEPARVLLVGGATRSAALRALAPAVLGRAVAFPAPGEYVALGAARQAAWALAGSRRAAALAAQRARADGLRRTRACASAARACGRRTAACATAPERAAPRGPPIPPPAGREDQAMTSDGEQHAPDTS